MVEYVARGAEAAREQYGPATEYMYAECLSAVPSVLTEVARKQNNNSRAETWVDRYNHWENRGAAEG